MNSFTSDIELEIIGQPQNLNSQSAVASFDSENFDKSHIIAVPISSAIRPSQQSSEELLNSNNEINFKSSACYKNVMNIETHNYFPPSFDDINGNSHVLDGLNLSVSVRQDISGSFAPPEPYTLQYDHSSNGTINFTLEEEQKNGLPKQKREILKSVLIIIFLLSTIFDDTVDCFFKFMVVLMMFSLINSIGRLEDPFYNKDKFLIFVAIVLPILFELTGLFIIFGTTPVYYFAIYHLVKFIYKYARRYF